MKTQWLVENDCFDTHLVEEIRRAGYEVKSCNYGPMSSSTDYLSLFEPHSCVVFRGSLEFSDQVRREASWVPGLYYNKEKYFCSHYYPFLHKYLLAQEYFMLPYGDLLTKKDFIFEHLGEEDAVFIRPDSGHKRFTGQLLYKERWERDIDHLGFYSVEPWEMCVLSRPRNVIGEWRFIVVDGEVISGSEYRYHGQKSEKPIFSWGAIDLAVECAKLYQPDRVFCIDICKTNSETYYLLELGCFSCCGLYKQNNLSEVINKISRVALEDWQLVNERM